MSPAQTGRTFDCSVCGSKYSRAEYLRRHARKHENVYPFKCPYPNCTKSFARSDVLLRHRRRQHPNDPTVRPAPVTRSTSGSPPASPVRLRPVHRGRRRLTTPDYSPSLDEPLGEGGHGREEEDEKHAAGVVLLHDPPSAALLNMKVAQHHHHHQQQQPPHLSIETLQASHLPIVPPFQLSSAAYPPSPTTATSQGLYGSPPGSAGPLNDAFRHLLMHDAVSYLGAHAAGVPYLSPTLDHRSSPWLSGAEHLSGAELNLSSDESYHSPESDHDHSGYELQYPMTPDSADSVTFPIPPYSAAGASPIYARPLADLQRMLRMKLSQ